MSRASVASALARAERDPGPSARIAKHNISSHSSSYAIALPLGATFLFDAGRSQSPWRRATQFLPAAVSMLLPALIPTFLFVIPAEPRQRRAPESITTASGYGFRARGLRPRPGMTSQNLRGLV